MQLLYIMPATKENRIRVAPNFSRYLYGFDNLFVKFQSMWGVLCLRSRNETTNDSLDRYNWHRHTRDETCAHTGKHKAN